CEPLDTPGPVVVVAERHPVGVAVDHVLDEVVVVGMPRDGGDLARKGHGRGVAQLPRCWNLAAAPGTVEGPTVTRPLIGISSYGRAGERQTFSLPCEYVDVVRLVGGVPIVLPAVEGEIPEALDAIEALILPGGGDVDPAHYNGSRHEANYGIPAERGGFELALCRAALARPRLPVLCICRGMQLLNVALGGDLVPHIPDSYGEKVVHRHPERLPVEHPVRIEPGSHLASILGV